MWSSGSDEGERAKPARSTGPTNGTHERGDRTGRTNGTNERNQGVDEAVVLRILHTADWHLGLRFPSFGREDAQKLERARLDAVDKIFHAAEYFGVDAVLCAGDLFDGPAPTRDFWYGLSSRLVKLREWTRPVVLLPGNHDPLVSGSPYERGSEFRRGLPDFVHVVDADDFTLALKDDAILYARPCRSQAGQRDPALALPAREDGDLRVRIGMVHGTTFDLPGHDMHFPIARDAADRRGFDYLAIGDTHEFRDVRPDSRAPVVYPSAPEATAFDEKEVGYCAVVTFFRDRRRRPQIDRHPVAYWSWREVECRSLGELRALREEDLNRTVLRLRLVMSVSLEENREVAAILEELKGTAAAHGLCGVLEVHTEELRVDPRDADEVFRDLPDVLRATVERLRALEQGEDAEKARRALVHLYRLMQEG